MTGVLNSVCYYVFGMKEPDYTMKIMATGGFMSLNLTTLARPPLEAKGQTGGCGFPTPSHLIGISDTAMQLMTTTTFVMLCLVLRGPG